MRIACLILFLCASALGQSVFKNGTFSNGMIGGGAIPAAPAGGGYEANLYAYYKFDESSTPVIDSANAHNFSSAACGAVASSAGFIGTSHQINCYAGHSSPKLKIQRSDDGTTDFNFPNSFTVRLWFKTSMTGNSFYRNLVGEDGWNVYLGNNVEGDLDFFVSGNSTPNIDLGSAQTVNDGNWHRIIAWFDSSNGECGLQVDNNTPTTTIQADRYIPTGTTFFIGDNFGDSPDAFLDEVAFWNVTLTSDERLLDWNSGAGQTYPLP